ncbi:MAG: acyltransferase family protein [Acidimicrobiia bacterium]
MTTAQLADATPDTRERFVDFLRAASILVVVLGHWLMAVVVISGGTVSIGNVIKLTPGMWTLTWVLQVMPVFFFVGGFANSVGLTSVERKGGGWAEFSVGRVRRVMRPVGLLLAVWVPLILVLEQFVAGKTLRTATTLVSQPLWFIGIYLIVCAFAPPMLRWYRRSGWWSIAAVGAAAVLVDVVRFNAVDMVGYLNFAFVWLFAQQLGFAYADGSLQRITKPALMAIAGGALGTLAALVAFGPYPKSMVGLPGDKISNMAPPTICLAVCTVWQVALVMLLRGPANRWLHHRRPWTFTIAVNGRIMTIFCWHLTAALGAVGIAYALGAPFPKGGTSTWWMTRPVWLAVCFALLVPLVWIFGRFERPMVSAPVTVPFAVALPGVILMIVGLCGVAQGGLAPFFSTRAPVLGFIGFSPVSSVLEMVVGALLIAPYARHGVPSASAVPSEAHVVGEVGGR